MLREPLEIDGGTEGGAHAAMVEALVAGEGFARVAEIAEGLVGAPVGIFVPRPGSEGADGTAAERFVAELVAGGDPGVPEGIGEVVPIVAGEEVLGAVLMFGEPKEAAYPHLRDAALAALTGIAVMNALDGEGRPRGSLIEELLTNRELNPGAVIRMARLRGIDLSQGCVALCVAPGRGGAGTAVAAIVAECPQAVAERLDGRVYALLPGASATAARRLTARLAEHSLPALSSRRGDPAGARLALEEAELLLALAEAGGYERADGPDWDSIRVLFRALRADPEEIIRFSEETVGALVRHDEESGSELQVTFWAYQTNNCNMNLAAKATYTHRHTVGNRLARVEALTGLDPLDSGDRDLLAMALRAHCVAAFSRPT